MAVDITKLDEDDLLPALGNGEWVIVMPQGYPVLRVSTSWRDELIVWAGTRYIRWVLQGIYRRINHDYDPSWDHSGQVRSNIADPLMLRTLYDTLVEWLDNEYTGQGTPTYTSGYGMDWETHGDAVEKHMRECLAELCRSQFTDASDDFEDAFWEDADLVMSQVEEALLTMIRRIPTAEIWKQFEALAHQQIAEEKRLQAEQTLHFAQMRTLAQEFWQAYFSDLQQVRIEKPLFKELHLAERLREHFLDVDPAVVEAIAEVGLPGIFSNSVAEAIKKIACEAQR